MIKRYFKEIGAIQRTLVLTSYTWGIQATKIDMTKGNKNADFDTRNFKIGKRYDTAEKNENRALKWFNMMDAERKY